VKVCFLRKEIFTMPTLTTYLYRLVGLSPQTPPASLMAPMTITAVGHCVEMRENRLRYGREYGCRRTAILRQRREAAKALALKQIAERLATSIAVLEDDRAFPVDYPAVIERVAEEELSDVTRHFFRIAEARKVDEEAA
jgi:hypothetical protein